MLDRYWVIGQVHTYKNADLEVNLYFFKCKPTKYVSDRIK